VSPTGVVLRTETAAKSVENRNRSPALPDATTPGSPRECRCSTLETSKIGQGQSHSIARGATDFRLFARRPRARSSVTPPLPLGHRGGCQQRATLSSPTGTQPRCRAPRRPITSAVVPAFSRRGPQRSPLPRRSTMPPSRRPTSLHVTVLAPASPLTPHCVSPPTPHAPHRAPRVRLTAPSRVTARRRRASARATHALGGTRARRPKAEHAGRTTPYPRGGINSSSRARRWTSGASMDFGRVDGLRARRWTSGASMDFRSSSSSRGEGAANLGL
jgi:hypothetical protein